MKNYNKAVSRLRRGSIIFLALLLSLSATTGTSFAVPSSSLETSPLSTEELLSGLEFTTLDLQEISIDEVQSALAAGYTTSEELVDMYLARISAYDRPMALNSIIISNSKAKEDAAALDAERASGQVRGPLHGIPVIIKDNYDVDGMPTSAGSKVLQDSYPSDGAYTVKALISAGAIIIAKANLSEFANSRTNSQSSLGGTAHNPYSVGANGLANRASGGSSGGSGVSVAANFALASMGSDTGGSIRSPSHANGLFGLKPTWGLTSREGVIPLVLARDVTGPLARTATDIAYMMDAISGTDPQDSITADADTILGKDGQRVSFTEYLDSGALASARIGWMPESRYARPASGATLDAYNAVNGIHTQWETDMKAKGATFVDIDFPYTSYYNALYRGDPANPSASNLNTGWGPIDIEQYFRALPTKEEMAARGITEAMGRFGINPVHSQIDIRDLGTYASNGSGDYMISSITSNANSIANNDANYNWQAGYYDRPDNGWRFFLQNRATYQAALDSYLSAMNLDCFAYFMWRGPATSSGTAGDNAGYLQNIVSHGGFPDMVIPIGVTGETSAYPAGMPVCVDLVGRAWDDGSLIKLAYAYEQAYPKRADSEYTPALPDEKVLLRLETIKKHIYNMDLAPYTNGTLYVLNKAMSTAEALGGKSPAQSYIDVLYDLADAYDALTVKDYYGYISLSQSGGAVMADYSGHATISGSNAATAVLASYRKDTGALTDMKSLPITISGDGACVGSISAAYNPDLTYKAFFWGSDFAPICADSTLMVSDVSSRVAMRTYFAAPSADRSELEVVYAVYANIETDVYTPDSAAAFNAAMDEAARVLAGSGISAAGQSVVDETLAVLKAARQALEYPVYIVPTPTLEDSGEPADANSNEYDVTVGD